MKKNQKIVVKGLEVVTFRKREDDYISLTDIARYKVAVETDDVIKNWMRNRSTVEFLGLWEKLNNPKFKPVEFDGFRNEAGSNYFVLSASKWIEDTNAIGIVVRKGRYGGTFAHKDIAFEFASWISSEFKLFLIKEFQRLKDEENKRLAIGWNVRRALTKINYRIHTDAVKEHLIPLQIVKSATRKVYADEADVLNVALYGMTAKDWRERNRGKDGNIRDYSDVAQLVVLANLEGFNAEFIKQSLSQSERLVLLNKIAISQMKSLVGNASVRKLK